METMMCFLGPSVFKRPLIHSRYFDIGCGEYPNELHDEAAPSPKKTTCDWQGCQCQGPDYGMVSIT